jgi:hypothetical protein
VPVYIIRAGDTEMVKIGWTSGAIASRIKVFQPGCWETLRLLRAIPLGTSHSEGWLHQRFSASRMSRDWFRFCTEMLTVEVPCVPGAPPHLIGSLTALIVSLGGPADLARDLGIYRPIPTTVHWGTRGIPPRYWHKITELAAAKGIKITAHDLERMPVTVEAVAA